MSGLTFKDRVKGMLYGLALGDAMGVSTEFSRTSPKMKYDGYIPTIPFDIRFNAYYALKVNPGSVSDDTEMSIALLRGLVKKDMKYDRDTVLKNYMEWANSGVMLGKNTRKLLKGVATIKGYENRFKKLEENEKLKMQSNGSLMRSSPLALIPNYIESIKAMKTDVYLTNPNKVNMECGFFYVSFLRSILKGNDLSNIDKCIELYKEIGEIEEIKDIFNDLETDRDVSDRSVKGWVCSALYMAIKAFKNFDSFQDAMDWIIREHPGSDTDTNGAIAGAMIGAHFGYEKLSKESRTKINIERLNNFFSTYARDNIYTLLDIDNIIDFIDTKWKKMNFI